MPRPNGDVGVDLVTDVPPPIREVMPPSNPPLRKPPAVFAIVPQSDMSGTGTLAMRFRRTGGAAARVPVPGLWLGSPGVIPSIGRRIFRHRCWRRGAGAEVAIQSQADCQQLTQQSEGRRMSEPLD
jgi:hypothetical protein